MSLRNSIQQSVCPNARNGSPDAKRSWDDGKDLSHIGVVCYIAEHTLHHANVAIEDASDTSTWAFLQSTFGRVSISPT